MEKNKDVDMNGDISLSSEARRDKMAKKENEDSLMAAVMSGFKAAGIKDPEKRSENENKKEG